MYKAIRICSKGTVFIKISKSQIKVSMNWWGCWPSGPSPEVSLTDTGWHGFPAQILRGNTTALSALALRKRGRPRGQRQTAPSPLWAQGQTPSATGHVQGPELTAEAALPAPGPCTRTRGPASLPPTLHHTGFGCQRVPVPSGISLLHAL